MTRSAPKSLAVARAVRRRAMAADFLCLIPRYVAGAGCAAGAAVAIGRYSQIPISWQAVAIGGAGLAISFTAVHAASKRWTLRQSAQRADSTLGLQDQIGNALELAARDATGFGELAIASGEKVAATVDVSRTVNLRWWSKWWIGSVAAASLAVAAWFYSPLPSPAPVTKQDAKKALEDARKIAEAQPAPTPDQSIESPKPELQELAQIEKELAQGAVSPTDAASRAANVLERVADERAKSAEAVKAQTESARESLAQAAKPAEKKSPADSSNLRKALQAGDLETAAAEAQKLAENAERLTADERSLLESDLRDLARALDEQARESAAEAEKLQQETREAQENSGEPTRPGSAPADNPSPNESNPAETPPPEDPKKAISDAARQAADELKQPQSEKNPSEKNPPAEKPATDSNSEKGDPKSQPPKSDASKNESQPPDSNPKESGNSGEPKQDNSAKAEPKPGDKPDEKSGEKSGEKPGDKPGEKSGEKTDNPPPNSGSASEKSQPGDNQKPGQTEKPAEGSKSSQTEQDQLGKPNSEQNSPSQPQGQSPNGQAPAGQQPDPKNGDQKSAAEKADQSNSGKPAANERPSENGTPQSGGEQPKPAPGGAQPQGNSPDAKKQGSKEAEKDGGGTGLQKLANQLKDLQKKSKDAANNEKSSTEMREQARKILESMDPAQRKELQKQLAGGGKGEGEGNGAGSQPAMPKDQAQLPDWSGASKIVDFRTKPGNAAEPGKERVISDWQKDMPDGQRDGSQAGSAMEEDIRQAKESAERAIEQQSVPAQHRDLVRRVFEKFNQRVDAAKKSAPSAVPSTPAPDAKPAGGGSK